MRIEREKDSIELTEQKNRQETKAFRLERIRKKKEFFLWLASIYWHLTWKKIFIVENIHSRNQAEK